MFKYLPRNMNGVFAINKPSGVTSLDVVQTVSRIFDNLAVFANDLSEARKLKREQLTAGTRWTKLKIENRVARLKTKVGHGGTLDPMALGVLIIGVGLGTKQLKYFLGECTKTYEATAMVGQSTTTGDSEGEVLTRTETEHVTLEKLKLAARKFTGKGKQTPPLFSALKVDGMALYDYARQGIPLPRAIEAREATVHALEVHEFGVDDKYKPMKLESDSDGKTLASMLASNSTLNDSELIYSDDFMADESVPELEKATLVHPRMLAEDAPPRPSLPVFTATATVGSGTYIRSLLSDIGRAVESSAHMVALKRTQQSDWKAGVNTFELSDITERDERLWGPVLKRAFDNGADIVVEEEFKKAEEMMGPLFEAEAKAEAAAEAAAEAVKAEAEAEAETKGGSSAGAETKDGSPDEASQAEVKEDVKGETSQAEVNGENGAAEDEHAAKKQKTD